mmetsp:Transcript_95923/g.165329  ORF Transcript_95923/g.165329 Transcript_95923/m.165329 type:complete len:277 (+) Transcript_95923:11902-12732(+)
MQAKAANCIRLGNRGHFDLNIHVSLQFILKSLQAGVCGKELFVCSFLFLQPQILISGERVDVIHHLFLKTMHPSCQQQHNLHNLLVLGNLLEERHASNSVPRLDVLGAAQHSCSRGVDSGLHLVQRGVEDYVGGMQLNADVKEWPVHKHEALAAPSANPFLDEVERLGSRREDGFEHQTVEVYSQLLDLFLVRLGAQPISRLGFSDGSDHIFASRLDLQVPHIHELGLFLNMVLLQFHKLIQREGLVLRQMNHTGIRDDLQITHDAVFDYTVYFSR